MKGFKIALGVLSIIASVFCIARPALTFAVAGWLVAILLCAWAFNVLINFFRNRHDGIDKISTAGAVFALIGGIAALIMSVVIIFKPGLSVIGEAVFLYILAGWLIFSGILSIVGAVKVMRPAGDKKWVFTMIFGILTILGGTYSLVHVLVLAWAAGLVFAIQMLIYGIRLIGSAIE